MHGFYKLPRSLALLNYRGKKLKKKKKEKYESAIDFGS